MKRQVALGLPSTASFWLGIFVSVLQGLFAVALLATSAWLISRAAEQPPVMYLMIAVVGVRAFALGRASFRYFERILLHDSAFRQLSVLRPRIFEARIPFAPAGLTNNNRAQAISSLVEDVDELQNFALRIVPPIAQSLVVTALAVIFLAITEPDIALTLLIGVCGGVAVVLFLGALVAGDSDSEASGARAALARSSADLLQNLDLIMAYDRISNQISEVSARSSIVLAISNRQSKSVGIGQGLFLAIAALTTAMSTWLGAIAVQSGNQPGVMLAVYALLPIAVFDVVISLQPLPSLWRRYRSSANRILQDLERKLPEELNIGSSTRQLETVADISLVDISIRYPQSKMQVVKNFSMHLKSSETIALVGPSGAGKSSIANVLVGFLKPSAGTYSINGMSVSEYDIDSVRTRIGYLEQSPTIFLGTVKANLLLAQPQASDEQLWQTLQRVGLAKMFESRQGLQTELGQSGSLISGGEAQRLALARALLADFDVLIFDEPTANVDQESAAFLVADLLKIATIDKGRAVVLITHEPQFAALADRQYVV